MYRPPAFAEDDARALAGFVAAHPLAALVVNGDAQGPVAAHLPLVAEIGADGGVAALVGHVARANPLWRGAAGAPALAIFIGADSYVSPGAYPSKARDGRVVPTWNYLRVEARGVLEVEEAPDRLRPHLDALTQAQEAARPSPWAVGDAPSAYVDRLSQGIVGLRLRVERLEGVFKLSQNKSAEDHAGVLTALAASPKPADRAVAQAMRGAADRT